MILGSRSSLSAKTDSIGTDHLWRHRPFSTLLCIIFYPAGRRIYRPSGVDKHLTQDVPRFDPGLVEPKTID